MTRRLGGMLVLLALVSCGPKTKPVMVAFDRSALATVQLIAQTELDLSKLGLLTPQQALQIRLKLKPVIEVGEKATAALLLWQPGQATPTSVLELSLKLTDLVNTVVLALPDSEAKARILTAIVTAQNAWATVMRLLNGGQADYRLIYVDELYAKGVTR